MNIQRFIDKAKGIHGDYYDYSKAYAETGKDKTIFICPIHGEFIQTWNNHIYGKSGCSKCKKCYKWTNEEWIEEVSKRHNYKYDYSKTLYTKAKEKVIVICHEKDKFGKEHGEFAIRAGNHMSGIGCPKCGKKYNPSTGEWVEQAKQVHNDKYDYSKVNYKNQKSIVTIICPLHGEFKQQAGLHLQGCGCPVCGGSKPLTTEEWVKRATNTHGNKYDYSESVYANAKTPVAIKCLQHGMFYQQPYLHVKGYGCPKCKSSRLETIVFNRLQKENILYTFQYKIKTTEHTLFCDFLLDEYNIVIECQGEQHFIPTSFSLTITKEQSIEKYNELVSRDAIKYLQCKSEGKQVVYFTIPDYFNIKDINIYTDFYKDKLLFTDINELIKYIKQQAIEKINDNYIKFYNDVIRNVSKKIVKTDSFRLKYGNYRIIYVPLKGNQRNELNELRRLYKKRGIKSIIIFEDEYLLHRDIVISKLRHILKINTNLSKIMARKCKIQEIMTKDAELFLNKNHIQGFGNSTVYLGAFYNNTLVAVMGFLKEHNNNWNLTRFASDNSYICCGIGGKLFNYFIRKYPCNIIKSFADKRWTFDKENNVYTKLGFKLDLTLFPDYRYIQQGKNERFHKFNFRKKLLINRYPDKGLDMSMTENEMTKKLGFKRIWDCGLYKYVWHNNEQN